MTTRALCIGVLLFCALPATGSAAGRLELDGSFVQGGLVLGRAEPGAKVTFEGREMRVSREGEFLIGFGRDAGPEASLVVTFANGARAERRLAVESRRYDVQRIDGLPERQVTPSAEELARIKAENALIGAARARNTAEPLFKSGFVWPVVGPISGVYGSQRILNGQPRQPHFGVDIAAPTGTQVAAAADGIVSLAHEDMFFTGKTLIIDHGHGLSSVYSHLSAIDVREGRRVRQGEVVGKVGATGRVTGAHLDWRVNLFDIRLDPALIAGPMPAATGPALPIGRGG